MDWNIAFQMQHFMRLLALSADLLQSSNSVGMQQISSWYGGGLFHQRLLQMC
jgi:hypothetical protein